MINNNIEKAINVAKELNNQSIFIPLIDGFTIKLKSENGFLAANNQNFTERFATSDAYDDFDNLIEKDINSTISYGKNNNIIIDNNNVVYYEDYNYSFQYKVYFRDVIVNKDSFMREVFAYFINSRNNSFNVVSLSTCLFPLSGGVLLKDVSNLKDDNLINYLLDSMLLIIKNIK